MQPVNFVRGFSPLIWFRFLWALLMICLQPLTRIESIKKCNLSIFPAIRASCLVSAAKAKKHVFEKSIRITFFLGCLDLLPDVSGVFNRFSRFPERFMALACGIKNKTSCFTASITSQRRTGYFWKLPFLEFGTLFLCFSLFCWIFVRIFCGDSSAE